MLVQIIKQISILLPFQNPSKQILNKSKHKQI
jgi:hypothetical protein